MANLVKPSLGNVIAGKTKTYSFQDKTKSFSIFENPQNISTPLKNIKVGQYTFKEKLTNFKDQTVDAFKDFGELVKKEYNFSEAIKPVSDLAGTVLSSNFISNTNNFISESVGKGLEMLTDVVVADGETSTSLGADEVLNGSPANNANTGSGTATGENTSGGKNAGETSTGSSEAESSNGTAQTPSKQPSNDSTSSTSEAKSSEEKIPTPPKEEKKEEPKKETPKPSSKTGANIKNGNVIDTGNPVSSGKQYNLSDDELAYLAYVAMKEQGSVEGAKVELSLMINQYEKSGSSKNVDDYIRNSSWYASGSRTGYYYPGDSYVEAARDVMNNGNRYVGSNVVEHDYMGDITSISTGSKSDRSNYVPGETIIYNRYGAKYVFVGFAPNNGDPFGYPV